MSRLVSFFILAAVAAVVGLLFFQVMAQFLVPLFLAIVMTVIFRPVHRWIGRQLNGRESWAALLTTLLAAVAVLGPLLLILFMAVAEGVSLYSRFDVQAVEVRLDRLRRAVGLELPPSEVHKALTDLDAAVAAMQDIVRTDPEVKRPVGERIVDASERLAEVCRVWIANLEPGEAAKDRLSEKVEAVREEIKALREAVRVWQQAETPGDQRLAENEVWSRFAEIKRALVGNQLVYWLKLQANPSEQQLREMRQQIQEWLGPWALTTTQYVGSFIISIFIGSAIMLLGLYYFLVDGRAMVQTIMQLSPLKESYEERMIKQFDVVSRAVVLATLLSAGAQGLLAGVGYLLADFHAVFLLTFATMILALVPFVGAAAVWGPCALWLLLVEQRVAAAIALATYGMVVVSMADNIIKPLVLRGHSNLHPLLALLSVIGGVQVLGPIGIFVGPMIVAFLQTLLVMLNEELQSLSDAPPQAGSTAQTSPAKLPEGA